MSFNIGLSGLNAASKDLEVTGNNIANAATVGFKESRAEFADIYASSYHNVSGTSTGSGVRVASVTQQFSQGTLDYTESSLDLAINGDGFFVMRDTNDEIVYTRAGAFEVDSDGYVVNSSGLFLQVYPVLDTGNNDIAFNTGVLGQLQLDFGNSPPNATDEITGNVNLSSGESPPAVAPFDNTDPDTYNYSSAITVYDSLGVPHTQTLYFVKTTPANPANPTPQELRSWTVHMALDGTILQDTAVPPANLAFPLIFDADGNVDTTVLPPANTPVATVDFTGYDPGNGATIGDANNGYLMSIDMSEFTQYGTSYAVNDLNQNGYTTGTLSGFDVDDSGVVFARYTNGQSQALGQVAMSNFTNPQGLQKLGDNLWAETYSSGNPVYGVAGTGNLGMVQSGALEQSNVDLAEELVDLITAQRNYQANAQTISTADEMTQTIINIR